MSNPMGLKATVLLLSVASSGAMAASVPNRVIVKFKQQSSVRLMMSEGIQDELGLKSHVMSMRQGVSVLRYASDVSPKEAARVLAARSDVEWAQPDYILSLFPQPQEEQVNLSGGLDSLLSMGQGVFGGTLPNPVTVSKPNPIPAPALPNPPQVDPQLADAWGLGKIQAPKAWKLQPGSHKILVADIDTGIDYTHEDLVNNLAPGIGYDFTTNTDLPYDDNMHGTHTAGSIGAVGGNGIGVAGVSPTVSLMALKFLTGEGSGTTSDAVRAIDYAVEHGARVLSNSWGGPADDESENKVLEDAVERANQAGVLFVAAAGNDGADNDSTPVYPAAINKPNMLTVAATTSKDGLAFFSNYGNKSVHVAAPGAGVLSTVPGNGYSKLSGTSMACPHVAGLAALILAERPELTPVQVKQIIMESVDALPILQGKVVSGGRVNAAAAIQRAKTF